jgi:5-methylcytosine-specific restriction endonuclease McrA
MFGEETFITDAGEPYVEFHHLIPFNIAYGPDHYLNLFALCPNCHRKIHFLKIEDKHEQYENLSNNNYLHICFVDRLMELKTKNLLKSYLLNIY